MAVCGWEIGSSRSAIDQLRWHLVDPGDKTLPTHFMKVTNFKFHSSFHRSRCVGGDLAITWVAKNDLLIISDIAQYLLNAWRHS